MISTVATTLTLFALGVLGGAEGDSPTPPPVHVDASARDDVIDITGLTDVTDLEVGSDGSAPHLQRMRAPICPTGTENTGNPLPCPGDPVEPLPQCGAAATLPPLWERTVPDAVPTPWRLIGTRTCATEADVTPAMVLSAFRRLPLASSPLVVQPDRGWVLVNKPTVVHADRTPQTLTTTILGTTVTITATPTSYAWDFGDGVTLTTTDPGRPWPDGTLTHAYTRTGDYRIALTTTWSAVYTVGNDPTVRDVPGTATTTSTAPLSATERRSHLVGATCDTPGSAPGC